MHLSAPSPGQIELRSSIEPRPAGSCVPLTATQLQWWKNTAERRNGISERLLHLAMRIHGATDIALLHACLDTLVQRHEALRTRIVASDSMPIQHVNDISACSFDFFDLSQSRSNEASALLTHLAEAFVKEAVDLKIGPLFAARLFRLSAHEHVLVLAFEHIIADMLSIAIVQRELSALYRHGAHGRPLSIPQRPLQLGDYAFWQQATFSAWRGEHEAYWRSRLNNPPITELPIDRRPELAQDCEYSSLEVPFGTALSSKLRDLARREQTSIAMIVLVIYVATMTRWCNKRDLLIKFISHGRFRPELLSMVGFVAGYLHLRIETTDDDSFIDVLKRTTLELQCAYEHRDLDRVPLIIPECSANLFFDWIPAREQFVQPQDGSNEAELKIQSFPLEVAWPREFLIWFRDSATGVVASITYQTKRFRPQTIEQLQRNLEIFAEEFSRRPRDPMSSIATP